MGQKTEVLSIKQLEARKSRHENLSLFSSAAFLAGFIVYGASTNIYSEPVDYFGTQILGIDKISETTEFNIGVKSLLGLLFWAVLHHVKKAYDYDNQITNRHYHASTRPR